MVYYIVFIFKDGTLLERFNISQFDAFFFIGNFTNHKVGYMQFYSNLYDKFFIRYQRKSTIDSVQCHVAVQFEIYILIEEHRSVFKNAVTST